MSSKTSPETHKTSEKKEKRFNYSSSSSDLVASALAFNDLSRSSLRPKRKIHNVPLIEKIIPSIKKIPSFSTSSSLLLQDRHYIKEKFYVKKDVRIFKTSPSHQFPASLYIETGETFATKNVDSSKNLISVKKYIRINSVFRRKLGSKSFLVSIESSPNSPRAST